MSEGFAYLDILFFAMLAAFIAFRLRGVLGRKTGSERPRPTAVGPRGGDADVAAPPSRAEPINDLSPADASPDQPDDPLVRTGLTRLRMADPSFDVGAFVQGARGAFAMIVEAFAKGDKDALEPLLGEDVYRSFSGAINSREDAGQRLTTEVVSFDEVDVSEIAMAGAVANVTVRFATHQINITTDHEGNNVDGQAHQSQPVVDLWTFSRDTRSSDPNWRLVETRTPED